MEINQMPTFLLESKFLTEKNLCVKYSLCLNIQSIYGRWS